MRLELPTEPHDLQIPGNTPKRVLFLVPNLNFAGGVANYYRILLPRLKARSNGVHSDYLEMPIGGKGLFSKAAQLAAWVLFTLTFMAYVLAKRPSLVVFNPSLTRFCLFRDGVFINLLHLLHRRCRTLVFFRGWNIANETYLSGPNAQPVTARLLRPDVMLSLTAHSQKVLAGLVGAATWLQPFQTVVDPELQDYLTANAPCKKVKNSYLFLGNVTKEKGIFELLEAFRRLAEENPDVKLVICGQGAASDAVAAFIKTHGLQARIETPGTVHGPEKFRRLAEAEVFVLPSYTEGMPNAVLEALAAECLVLGTPVGAMGGFIERDYIAALEVKSPDSILKAMVDMDILRAKTDKVGVAKEVIRQFGIETTLEFFDAQFRDSDPEQAIAQRRQGRTR